MREKATVQLLTKKDLKKFGNKERFTISELKEILPDAKIIEEIEKERHKNG